MTRIDESITRGHWEGQQFVYYRTPRERLRDATTGKMWHWLRRQNIDTRYPVQDGPGTRATNPHWPWWRESYGTDNNHAEGWSVDPTFRGAVTEPPGWWDSHWDPVHPHLLAIANWLARHLFRRQPLRIEPLDTTMTAVIIDQEDFALFPYLTHNDESHL
jgi:hypothetical protein